MCGIFGATDRERFLTLYDLNRKRGTFATSLCLLTTTGDMVIHKWQGTPKVEGVVKAFDKLDLKIKYYLGHTQAPTSSSRKYNKNTAHPFKHGTFAVAHNGVLTNFDDLKANLNPKWKNPVDSSIIPYAMALYRADHAEDQCMSSITIDSMVNVLNLLEGTYGLWIFDTLSSNIFIARCGSTLFMNAVQNEFSSVKFKSSEPVDEGKVYQITPEGLTSVALFDFNSPFFT